jgi:hypothetical protein
VISILADPLIVDMYNGVTDDRHVFDFERDLSIVVNQDCGVRTWNGYQYSNNIIYKQIQNKIKLLDDFLITYDEKYGVLIYGTDAAPATGITRAYDKVYVVGIRPDKYVGSSEFQNLPYPDPTAQPVIVNSRNMYFSLGNQNSWVDGKMSRWLSDSYIDVPSSDTPLVGRDIAWSFTTSDDLSSDQSIRLRQLETHLYVAGRGTYVMVPKATNINCSIYNDIGALVTTSYAINSFPLYKADIAFDKRVEGNRIRYKFAFDNSFLVVNGCTTYYVSYDKAASPSDRESQEYNYQTELNTLVTWLTRSERPDDAVTGQTMTTVGTVSKITGPDGRDYSAYSTGSGLNYLYLPVSLNTPASGTTWQM